MKPTCYSFAKEKSYKKHCQKEAKLLSVEKRQEFIDYMWQNHMNVGDAAVKADLNNEQTHGIMVTQLQTTTFFNPVAV